MQHHFTSIIIHCIHWFQKVIKSAGVFSSTGHGFSLPIQDNRIGDLSIYTSGITRPRHQGHMCLILLLVYHHPYLKNTSQLIAISPLFGSYCTSNQSWFLRSPMLHYCIWWQHIIEKVTLSYRTQDFWEFLEPDLWRSADYLPSLI